MTCEHCVHAIAAALRELDGLSDVAVEDNAVAHAAVTVTSDSPLTTEAVAAALDETGDHEFAARPPCSPPPLRC